jgi:hypothetical protein
MITMNVPKTPATPRLAAALNVSLVTTTTCVLETAVILTMVANSMKLTAMIITSVQMIPALAIKVVYTLMLSVMIIMFVRLIPVVKRKDVNILKSAVMIIMLVQKIIVIPLLDV